MSEKSEYDVTVLGAGIAGLSAAYYLKKLGKTVIVLEAKDRIGGRLLAANLKCKTGSDTWDLGGQWVGSAQHHVMELINELGMEVYKQYTDGKRYLLLGDSGEVKLISGNIPNLAPLALLDIYSFIKKIDKMADTLNPDDLLSHKQVVEWDSMTLHSFMNETCKNKTSRDFLESLIKAFFGLDSSQLSLFYFLYGMKQAGGFESVIETGEGGGQEFKVKGSAWKICDELADKISRENIICGDPVSKIVQTQDGWVTVKTKAGRSYKAMHVISAVPPHLVNEIEFDPPLPFEQMKMRQQMPVGHMIKFVITYQTAFWREEGKSGDILCIGAPCSVGPLGAVVDGSTTDNPALVGFICAEQALYWTKKSMEERKVAVLESLSKVFGKKCLDLIEYQDKDWTREPYNGGCPGGVFGPRGLLYYYHVLTEPHGRIHWAGTELAKVFTGYMDGAIESGKRAVDEVMGKSDESGKPKDAFFYHDSYVSRYDSKKYCNWVIAGAIIIGLAAVCSYYLIRMSSGEV